MPLKPNRTRWDDALSRVDPTQFEILLADHYRREGWQVEHVGAEASGRTYDGGIDLKLRRDDEYVIVQCKRWTACQVPHNAVHELLGIMVNEGASGSILATCGEFTAAAISASERQGHVQLIDGTTLRAMLDPAAVNEASRQNASFMPGNQRVEFRPRNRRAPRPAWSRLIGPAVALIACAAFVGFVVPTLRTTTQPVPHTAASSAFPKSARYPGAAKPQQAGQPINPYALAGHVAAVRADAILGNSAGAEAHLTAISNDVMRSGRVPDSSRPIDREAARAVVRPLPGVRSVIWLDRSNFVVMVDGARYRDMAMIDQVCVALEPLGDTLAVVVNVQDATATTADGAATLSRNCQLPQGQRAFMQGKRQVDVISPELRATFKAMQRR